MSYVSTEDFLAQAVGSRRGAGIYQRGGKRALDVLTVVLSLPFVLPVIALFWLVMFFSGGTGFYRQTRIGTGGQEFTCWKIRTMAGDADQKLADILKTDPNFAREWRESQKLQNDPRITALGRFIRKTSIDELPQLWNVLVGEMSLIGPRPFTPNQKALYDAQGPARAYYHLRPGITGLWQVKSRNSGTFKDRITFDEAYAHRLTFVNDLKIFFQTIAVVLRATGR